MSLAVGSFNVLVKTANNHCFCRLNTSVSVVCVNFLHCCMMNTEQREVCFDEARSVLEPFFARLSDTWIEGVGRVEFAMKLLDNRLGFIQMADVVFRRKLGSSSL